MKKNFLYRLFNIDNDNNNNDNNRFFSVFSFVRSFDKDHVVKNLIHLIYSYSVFEGGEFVYRLRE